MNIITPAKLKKLLIDSEFLTREQFEKAEKKARRQKKDVDEVLVDDGLISDERLGLLIAQELNIDFVNLRKEDIKKEVINLVPEVVARKQHAIAFGRDKNTLKLAMADPYNLNLIKLIEKRTGNDVKPYYATLSDIEDAIKNYRIGIEKVFAEIIEENVRNVKESGVTAEEAALDMPIIKIVDTIIEYAYDNRSSDIHIEPYEEHVIIRFRVDGILHDVLELPKNLQDLIITRLKIMSKLRTDERRAAQDGRIDLRIRGDRLDIRVSIVPITDGEKVVMRLLSETMRRFNWEELGLSNSDFKKVQRAANRPYGMILATGPSGSGKTTTLYSVLKQLNKREVNIATIEDPVEYDIEGVNQIQVNPRTELTFAKGLRSILRQDPDIIMVGEIRDPDTAAIAVNAAMTGHLVLSTLHTNDAATTLPRFLEMGVEPFLIASTVNVAIGQRLVRKICSKCIQSEVLKDHELDLLKQEVDLSKMLKKENISSVRLYRGKGCKTCNNSGYSGRVGIFEVLEMSEEIRQAIMRRSTNEEIKQIAIKNGMTTMIYDGIQKALQGQTTIEEVLRVSRM